MKYRREIDGLRTIAVIPVVLFHAGLNFFSGGFVGVDVFFVISGYLITTTLVDDLGERGYSVAHFYERRARRILPALFLVMFACLPFAWALLLPQDMDNFSRSLASVTVFASNFFFEHSSNYFDTKTILKPLIHTWSLSVEEQYYVLFPLLLALLWKYCRQWLTAIVAGIAVASLLLAEYYSTRNPSLDFYLLPTRAWELMIGALTSFALAGKATQNVDRRIAQILSLLGLGLIAYSIIVFTERTPFPGFYALPPTLGAALVILFSSGETVAGRVLATRGMVGIGLLSYSIYLWHQPLLAFARHYSLNEPNSLKLAAISLTSIPMAYLTWKFVEQPFRRKGTFSRRQIAIFSAACSLVFLLIGIAGYKTSGVFVKSWRSADYIALSSYSNYFDGQSEEQRWNSGCFNLSQGVEFFARNQCEGGRFPDRPSVFLLGDSHSAYLSQNLRPYLEGKRYNLFQYSTAYCTPLSTLDKNARCAEINRYILRRLSEVKPDYVVLFAYYSLWAQTADYGEPVPLDEMIRKKTEEFVKLGVKHVIVIGPIPTWKISLPSVAFKYIHAGEQIPERTKFGVSQDSLEWDGKLRAMSYPNEVSYVSLKDLLCNQAGCRTVVGPDLSRDLVVFDYGHLTTAGAAFVTQNLLAPYFKGDEPPAGGN